MCTLAISSHVFRGFKANVQTWRNVFHLKSPCRSQTHSSMWWDTSTTSETPVAIHQCVGKTIYQLHVTYISRYTTVTFGVVFVIQFFALLPHLTHKPEVTQIDSLAILSLTWINMNLMPIWIPQRLKMYIHTHTVDHSFKITSFPGVQETSTRRNDSHRRDWVVVSGEPSENLAGFLVRDLC